VQKIRRTVERVDNERECCRRRVSIGAELLTDYDGAGKLELNGADDCGFGPAIDFRHEIRRRFLDPLELVELWCRLKDYIGCSASGNSSDGERIVNECAVVRANVPVCLQRVPHTG